MKFLGQSEHSAQRLCPSPSHCRSWWVENSPGMRHFSKRSCLCPVQDWCTISPVYLTVLTVQGICLWYLNVLCFIAVNHKQDSLSKEGSRYLLEDCP